MKKTNVFDMFCKKLNFQNNCNKDTLPSLIFNNVLMNERFQSKYDLNLDESDKNNTVSAIKDLLFSLNSEQNNLYREIKVNNILKSAKINTATKAGEHWSLYESSASASYDTDNYFGNVKFEGSIPTTKIDLLATIVQQLQYPEENEIIPTSYSDINLNSVKVKKYFQTGEELSDNEWIETFDTDDDDYIDPNLLSIQYDESEDQDFIDIE